MHFARCTLNVSVILTMMLTLTHEIEIDPWPVCGTDPPVDMFQDGNVVIFYCFGNSIPDDVKIKLQLTVEQQDGTVIGESTSSFAGSAAVGVHVTTDYNDAKFVCHMTNTFLNVNRYCSVGPITVM